MALKKFCICSGGFCRRMCHTSVVFVRPIRAKTFGEKNEKFGTLIKMWKMRKNTWSTRAPMGAPLRPDDTNYSLSFWRGRQTFKESLRLNSLSKTTRAAATTEDHHVFGFFCQFVGTFALCRAISLRESFPTSSLSLPVFFFTFQSVPSTMQLSERPFQRICKNSTKSMRSDCHSSWFLRSLFRKPYFWNSKLEIPIYHNRYR